MQNAREKLASLISECRQLLDNYQIGKVQAAPQSKRREKLTTFGGRTMKKKTIYFWATNGGDHTNEKHPYIATTEELIVLAAYWHETAEAFDVDAAFYEEGISSSQCRQQIYAYKRRKAICKLLDDKSVAEAIARGDDELRTRWGLSKEDWRVFQHSDDDSGTHEMLLERVRAEVNKKTRERAPGNHRTTEKNENCTNLIPRRLP